METKDGRSEDDEADPSPAELSWMDRNGSRLTLCILGAIVIFMIALQQFGHAR